MKLQVGSVVKTCGVIEKFTPEEVSRCILRHMRCDFGDICDEDLEANQWSVKNGGRIMSVYKFGKRTLWIITEHDRTVTTLLLPEEY